MRITGLAFVIYNEMYRKNPIKQTRKENILNEPQYRTEIKIYIFLFIIFLILICKLSVRFIFKGSLQYSKYINKQITNKIK